MAALHPLIILLLLAEWIAFAVCAGWYVLRGAKHATFRPASSTGSESSGSAAVWAAAVGLGAFAAAFAAARVFSPAAPVLSTYTGLAHIVSGYHIADLEWNWTFPPDYPLAVPALAAAFVRLLGRTPLAFSLADSVLFALGAAGTALLCLRLFRSHWLAMACGAAAATLPLLLLFAGGDDVGIGYFGLAPWVILFALTDGSLLGRCAVAATTALLMQTRPEAPAFALVLPAMVWAVSGPGEGRIRLRALAVPLLAAGALCFPYFVQFYRDMIGSGRAGAELGLRLVPPLASVTAAVCAALLPLSARWRDRLARSATAVTVGLALFAAFCVAALSAWGISFFTPGAVCADDDCIARTFATVHAWILNPKLVPLPLIALSFVGLAAGARTPRLTAALVAWAGLVITAASTKATGELPFEGARTQLAAVPPFLLLAMLGLHELSRFRPDGKWRGFLMWGVVAATCALTWPFCLGNGGRVDYDEQQEFAFVRGCLPRLPAHSTLYAPDETVGILLPGDREPVNVDLFALFRTGFLAEAAGDTARGVRIAEASALLAMDADDLEARPAFFLHGLGCRRTGTAATSDICRAVSKRFRLVPVCEAVIPNRPYTSDFRDVIKIVGDTVQVGIYRVECAAPPVPGA